MNKKFDPKKISVILRRLLGYVMREYKLQACLVILAILGSVTANVAGTYIIKDVSKSMLGIRDGSEVMSTLLVNIAILMSVYFAGVCSTFLNGRLTLNISTGIMRKVRDDLFEHMQLLNVQYFAEHVNGETMSLYTNDTEVLRELLSMGLPQIINSVLMVIGVFAVMMVLSPLLTTFVIVILVVMMLTVTKMSKKGRKYFIAQQEKLSKVNGYVEEYIEGQKIVKIFCHEKRVKTDFNNINESLRQAAVAAHTYANVIMPVMNNLSFVSYVLIAIAGGLLVYFDLLGVDMKDGIAIMIAFVPAARQFSMPLSQVAQQFNAILGATAGAERIFNFLDLPVEKDNGYVTLVNAEIDEDGNVTPTKEHTDKWAWKHPHKDGTTTFVELKGEVCFEDVTFSYDGVKTVLNNVSLFAKPGQKVALVGSTGAGKTTITNLINRFYDVPDGKIRYDGININKIKKADLRRSLGMVLQDTHLFTGTVRENIRYGRLDATDEDVYAAATLANADSFIAHLPNGYDTVLTGDGSNLSQGQRQLINIARAAVADPPVLVLDEATSSVDTRTEKIIERGMNKLMQGRTVFIIAHRLSTIRNADVILVIENGEIIERGNHDTLLKERGRYYNLYTGMLELS